jgi:hypothetical protein
MENKPNFFSIMPATVRYSKDICLFSKILYSEITALANKEGFCWASNKYFAEAHDVTKDAVSRCISELEKNGFITCYIDKDAGNQRRIFANVNYDSSQKTDRGIGKKTDRVKPENINKNVLPLSEKKPIGIDEKTYHNNITNNTSKIRERRLSEKPKSNFSNQPENDTANPMLSSPTWDQVIFAGAKLMPVEPLPSENPFDERERAATYYENSQYVIQQGEKYTTDSDLVAVMANYYRSNPQEYKVGILQDAKGARFTPEQIKDFTVMWAAHAIANNKYNRTAHQLHMDLKRWILRESQYSAKSMKQAGSAAAPVVKKKTVDFI